MDEGDGRWRAGPPGRRGRWGTRSRGGLPGARAGGENAVDNPGVIAECTDLPAAAERL